MAANEDFILWLTEKLTLERKALREQHWAQHALLEKRHMQLLAATQVKLRDAMCHVDPGGEQPSQNGGGCASEELRVEACGNTLAIGAPDENHNADAPLPPDVLVPKDQGDCPQPEEPAKVGPNIIPQSSIVASASHQVMEKARSYKNQALKNLAGYRSTPSQHKNTLSRIVKRPAFELLSGLAILINTLILAAEIEYNGFDLGHDVDYKNYSTAKVTWPGVEPWFGYLDIIFVVFFILELLMRIGADGLQSVKSGWIWFDTIVVLCSVLSLLAGGTVASLDPTLLRIARLARMMRVFKMVRFVRAFDSLFLLIKSVQASVGALAWSFLLLISVEVAVGMCLSQMLRHYIQEDSNDIAKRREVFLLYGTFTRTLVTMFEITLGNWAPSCRILMDYVSEWYGLFYILYCCCFVFAVIRVIQAVFIAETNRVVANDDQIALTRKSQEKANYLYKLKSLFDELDLSGDGRISREEMQKLQDDKLLGIMMSTLDINVQDLDVLFELLDDGDGLIDIDEFVKGLSRVKGVAQSVDVVSLLRLSRKLEAKIDHMLGKLFHDAPGSSSVQLALSDTPSRHWVVRM